MDVTPLIPAGRQIIQSYGEAGFKINGSIYPGAVIVLPEKTWDWNVPEDFASLLESHFNDLISIADDIDVVLFGTGNKQEFFPPKMRDALKQKGLVVEAMESGAACRTYNVLMGEGRRIAAALLPL
jgi:uncharacterized protein